jgi:glycosyltransferase involved in cell wall biosynthesis
MPSVRNIESPLVTVITVTYNSASYVRDAIESILSSSYTNFELIIGDDASTDSTWSIIQEYKDERIVAYRNEKNIREYPNRNKAIDLAKGEYLLFIDGDDMIYPHGLEFMVRMLHAFPSCAMALMRWFRNDLFYPVVITPEQFYIGEYFGQGFLGTAFSNVLFRTSVLKGEGGIQSNYRSGDDYIRYKIAAKYDSLIINDGLTWWRETPGQASQLQKRDSLESLEPFDLKLEFIRSSSCPLSGSIQKQAEANLFKLLAKTVIKQISKFHFYFAAQIISKYHPPISVFFSLHKKPLDINPFSRFSPTNPCRIDIKSNPFSESIKV